ncbi:RNA recognition motif-containing protein [Toxoplasma gondii FOU]|uniref:RNA recognition motif-containing protein n=1 Tax=Toxoplasma gondii FOU TaxID=943167 RepID=A0A086L8N1_TOXGO|nr:RNA recognition motif-containing protein [Toxoplasma gondii FOU]
MREGRTSRSLEGSYDERPLDRPRQKKVFIGNLPVDVTDADLRPVLEKAGPVRSLQIRSSRATGGGRPRSLFAHVEFESEQACEALFSVLDYRVFKGDLPHHGFPSCASNLLRSKAASVGLSTRARQTCRPSPCSPP